MAEKNKTWPDWDFDKHCTNIPPEKIYKLQDFGHEVKRGDSDFAMTAPFTVLTPEAVKICRDIILHDENVRKHCKFDKCSHEMTANSFAFRNVNGVNSFYRGMLSCKRFEAYLRECCQAPVALWDITWLSGHVNVQEGKEQKDTPNVAWHVDRAVFAMLINISDMPENPKGGGTWVKKKNGEIIKFDYKNPGDSVIIQGSKLEHCGNPAENYNKIIIAPGLGIADVRHCDLTNNFNKNHFDNADPIDFMKQWTAFRLNKIEKQLELLGRGQDLELIENMKKENRLMHDNFQLFYEGITPEGSPWLA